MTPPRNLLRKFRPSLKGRVRFHFRHIDLNFQLELGEAVAHDMRSQLFQKLTTLPMSFFNKTRFGRIISRLTSDIDSVRVAVQDTGIGVDQEQSKRLFQAFFTTKANGLGMGLAISRSIIEAHGGRLWMTPNDGPGVTFQFALPVQNGGPT